MLKTGVTLPPCMCEFLSVFQIFYTAHTHTVICTSLRVNVYFFVSITVSTGFMSETSLQRFKNNSILPDVLENFSTNQASPLFHTYMP